MKDVSHVVNAGENLIDLVEKYLSLKHHYYINRKSEKFIVSINNFPNEFVFYFDQHKGWDLYLLPKSNQLIQHEMTDILYKQFEYATSCINREYQLSSSEPLFEIQKGFI